MHLPVASCLVLSLLAGPPALHGQAGASAPLSGVVLDSLSHAPVRRAVLCISVPVGDSFPIGPDGVGQAFNSDCVRTDTLGFYAFTTVPGVPFELIVSCFEAGVYQTHGLAFRHITTPLPRHLDIEADAGSCDQRPLERRSGRLTGLYQRGYHGRSLTLCGPDAITVDVAFGETMPAIAPGAWPIPDPWLPYGNAYVRLAGVLVGPDRYGWSGLSTFRLEVDTVVAVGPTGVSRCP